MNDIDFSHLVEAVDNDDTPTINKLLKELSARLIGFLVLHRGAEEQDAEDCAQEAIIKTLEKIRNNKIRRPEQILNYMLSASQNKYFSLMKRRQRKNQVYEEYSRSFGHQPQRLFTKLDKEQKQWLEWCIEQLAEPYKKFLDYWFTHPDSGAPAAANRFDITIGNAWTRKHRLIKQLNECLEKKSK